MELLSASQVHDHVEQQELTGGQGADHDATGAQAHGAQLGEADLLGDVDQTRGDGSGSSGAGLVDLRQQGVGRVGDDGGAHSGNHTGSQRHTQLGSTDQLGLGLAHGGGHAVGGLALDGELGHGVGHLLEQDGSEAGVESLEETIGGEQLGGTIEQTTGEGGLRHEADAGGLQRAEEDIGDGLGHGGRGQVDGGLVVPGLLVTQVLGELDFEELNTSELEPT